jgi:integrase
MASLCKKRGASGAESPYWQAVLSFNQRKVWVSTKCRNRGEARKVSDRWSRACELAQEWRLNQPQCDRLLAEIGGITKCPATLDNSRELFRRLMAETTGETYAGEHFNEYCEEWLKMRAGVTKPATLVKDEKTVRDFIESLPERRRVAAVGSITSSEVRRFRDGLVSEGISESTANLALQIVRSVFNDARKQGVVVVNPAEAIPLLKAHDTDTRVPFKTDEIKALLKVADTEWRGMVLLGFHGGLRISDAADLKWSNIDLVNRTMSFEQKKTGHRKKKHARLTTIFLHDDVVNYLASLASSDDPNAPLFPSLCGTGTSGDYGLSAQFGRIMEQAGVVSPTGAKKEGKGRVFRSLSYHSLRHSFCSRLANAEIPMEIRKQMSGHSSDAVHEGYSHLELDLQKAAIGKLGSVL